MKITEDTTLEKILKQKNSEEILKKHGVPCMTCPMAAQELNTLTIGEITQIYGLNLDAILYNLTKSKVDQKD